MKNLAKAAAIIVFIASVTSCDLINKPETESAKKIDTNTTVIIEETPAAEGIDTTKAATKTTEKVETKTAQPTK